MAKKWKAVDFEAYHNPPHLMQVEGIEDCASGDWITVTKEDAALIAAAPDLLEGCKRALVALIDFESFTGIKKIESILLACAIAKATAAPVGKI